MSQLVAVSAILIALLQDVIFPRSYTFLLPIYSVVSLGCYGLLIVGIGVLLPHDIAEAKDYLSGNGIVVGAD